MGLRSDTRNELRKETVTKIFGQPKDADLTTLEKELIAIAASIPTALGGGNLGHAGIIVEPEKYLIMTGGINFEPPGNPGVYPAGLALNEAAGTRAREEALLVAQYEIYKGVEQGMKDIIQDAVEADYLLKIEDEALGFLNQTPRQMLNHLRNRGGALDFADTKTLLAERDTEWNVSEVPQLYFNRVEKAMQGLTRAGINSDLNERRDMVIFYLKATGEFDAAVREWEAKPAADKTWANIKSFISTEYAKENKQNKLTARQFKANSIEQQAEATEEIINALTEKHTEQMENLIKSTTEAMKKMMELVQSSNKGNNNNKASMGDKKKKREEKRQKYNSAHVCKHCNK
jgi:hypothetical protein